MYIFGDKCLAVCSGPKDIERCPLIQSIKEEAGLKHKNWKVQRNEFILDHLVDVNIILFVEKEISEFEYQDILLGANKSSIHVFGMNSDKRLHELIPHAESFTRWSSICEYCSSDAVFLVFGNIVCRECKINLLEEDKHTSKQTIADSPEGANTNKRKVDLNSSLNSDSSSVMLIEPKRANFNETPPTMTTIINFTPDTSLENEINLSGNRYQ